jgi:hypothetical protein
MQDLATIQTKLNEDLFSTTQETCLALCRVQDITKKSKDKMYILCACSKYMDYFIRTCLWIIHKLTEWNN